MKIIFNNQEEKEMFVGVYCPVGMMEDTIPCGYDGDIVACEKCWAMFGNASIEVKEVVES